MILSSDETRTVKHRTPFANQLTTNLVSLKLTFVLILHHISQQWHSILVNNKHGYNRCFVFQFYLFADLHLNLLLISLLSFRDGQVTHIDVACIGSSPE